MSEQLPTPEGVLTDVSDDERVTMVHQLGRMNFLAISGGRVRSHPGGIDLPVSNGYSVRVLLHASDTYIVQRVFRRNAREYLHGQRERVYCDDLGEVAYRASCFRSYDENEW